MLGGEGGHTDSCFFHVFQNDEWESGVTVLFSITIILLMSLYLRGTSGSQTSLCHLLFLSIFKRTSGSQMSLLFSGINVL